jgi:excisionase family DNA binding protein
MENSILIQTKDEASFKSLVKDAVLEAFKEVSPIKPAEKFYTRHEIGEKLKVSLVSIDKAVADGRLKSYKLGGRVLFKESEINLEERPFRGPNHK